MHIRSSMELLFVSQRAERAILGDASNSLWVAQLREMSPIATETYAPMTSNSHVVASFHVHACLCAFASTHARVPKPIPVLHAHSPCAGMKLDAIYQSQIYNSGLQWGMNTLVSVADEGVERCDLLIRLGNYSRIYYQQRRRGRGMEETRARIMFGLRPYVRVFLCDWTRSKRDKDRSFQPSVPWVLSDLITVVLAISSACFTFWILVWFSDHCLSVPFEHLFIP